MLGTTRASCLSSSPCLPPQKEDNGAIQNILLHNATRFQQSGLAPGQEYDVKLEAVKNRTRGPAVNRNVKTSKSLLSKTLTYGLN